MKIYSFTPNISYSGGCIIVAANSPEEALGTIHFNKDCYLANFTDIEHCNEVKNLAPVMLTKPTVILDTLYVE